MSDPGASVQVVELTWPAVVRWREVEANRPAPDPYRMDFTQEEQEAAERFGAELHRAFQGEDGAEVDG